MNFLKKLGSIVIKIIGMWAGFAPLVQANASSSPTATKVIGEVTQAFGVITTAEQMFTAAYGANTKLPSQKLAAAKPFIAQLIQGTELLTGKKPKDETMFEQGVSDFTSALVTILNSYGE
jgi:hypothetical protein